MVSAETSTTRSTGAATPQEEDREKAFFETWLRLMERQKDATGLTQKLQSVLTRSKDTNLMLQDVRLQANRMSANDKNLQELVDLLNDFFFRDIVPALKRAKTIATTMTKPGPQQGQDPLDQYLEQGDQGDAMPQAFVDDMSGWDAPHGHEAAKSRKKKKTAQTTGGGEAEANEDKTSDDEISSEMFHDLLIANSLRLTAMQAPGYSPMVQIHSIQQQPAGAQGGSNVVVAASSQTAKRPGKGGRVVPPPIVTDLPPRSGSRSGSSPRTQSPKPARKDRISKRAAADLVAEQVLGVRTYGSAKEYMIRWQGIPAPLWIARRKAPKQAKVLIDMYATELRARENVQANLREAETVRKGKKRGTGQRAAAGGVANHADFYAVDHIVNHRIENNNRQYLVRWESYDESEDTWEDASKLCIDVPDIVDAYEKKLRHNRARDEAVQSAMSELIRGGSSGSKAKSTTKKRRVGEVAAGKRKRQSLGTRAQADGEPGKEKRRRVYAGGGVIQNHGNDGNNTSEDDYQFDVEEAELDEYTDEEFADRLNN